MTPAPDPTINWVQFLIARTYAQLLAKRGAPIDEPAPGEKRTAEEELMLACQRRVQCYARGGQ